MPLHEHIEDLADRCPDRLVLSAGPETLSAAELDQFGNRIAWSLFDRGVRPGDLVAVALPRDITLVAALLGVLKSGAAYVPIDPHLPAARIGSMLDDSGARYVLVSSAWAHVDPYATRTCLDPRDPDWLRTEGRRPQVDVHGSDAAYVIYTSGTTGLPKGVIVEHRNVDNLVSGWSNAISFPHGATMSSLATVAFDIFLSETILPMVYGLRVALATDEDVGTQSAIADFLARHNVTAIQATPSRLTWLLADNRVRAELAKVELLIVGGEAFPAPLLAEARRHTKAAIYNVYGPTEATVWTSAKLLTDDQPITIGQPIQGVAYHLVDESGIEPSLGELGELCISGEALARGYFGDPVKTRDRFGTGSRRYRTGDLARRLNNGEVQVSGRTDQQIKIDGYRVELMEVETVLAEADGVAAAVVVLLDGEISRTLVAAVMPASVDPDAVWAHAAQRLPRYMMPSTIVAVASLPLSHAGKADRRAVETLLREHVRTEEDPLDYVCAMVTRWLGSPVDPDCGGLLDLGVGSLNTARLVAEIACRYEVRLELSDVIAVRSLRHLADRIRLHVTTA
ncbi:non-ribosomal peptide synthetase [Solwaraspora sp. WMMB335]|uniref:non-ribosomal peptide synthetase n=1 Tax=Solwaraspora sp. WMMB335 TaxID=3404118 RepID=UPI003B92FE76